MNKYTDGDDGTSPVHVGGVSINIGKATNKHVL